MIRSMYSAARDLLAVGRVVRRGHEDRAAGVDLPAVKLRAVQIRHVFGLLHQPQVDEMQARHEKDGLNQLSPRR